MMPQGIRTELRLLCLKSIPKAEFVAQLFDAEGL